MHFSEPIYEKNILFCHCLSDVVGDNDKKQHQKWQETGVTKENPKVRLNKTTKDEVQKEQQERRIRLSRIENSFTPVSCHFWCCFLSLSPTTSLISVSSNLVCLQLLLVHFLLLHEVFWFPSSIGLISRYLKIFLCNLILPTSNFRICVAFSVYNCYFPCSSFSVWSVY